MPRVRIPLMPSTELCEQSWLEMSPVGNVFLKLDKKFLYSPITREEVAHAV